MSGAGSKDVGRVILRPKAARPFFARHPWVYAGSIRESTPGLEAGDEVAVYSAEGKFIARGLINPASALRVRLYRWEDETLDEAFWIEKLDQALKLRHALLGLGASRTAYRLVSSEGDGLSGLIVDRYDRWLVVQPTSRALDRKMPVFLPRLMSLEGVDGAMVRWDRAIARLEGVEEPVEAIHGAFPDSSIEIDEEGLVFGVDLKHGQKTGMFLDQRWNRKAAARYARGRDVLDLFCYTGGFSLWALREGAKSAIGIDRSTGAIGAAQRNAERNGLNAQFQVGDVMDRLEELGAEEKRFGMVVCDPPKFARTAADLENALKAYVKLNEAAMRVLEPGGVLVTCSCSGHVLSDDFAQVIARAGERAGREVRILERRGAAPDHPVAASCLESEYLKCYIAVVS